MDHLTHILKSIEHGDAQAGEERNNAETGFQLARQRLGLGGESAKLTSKTSSSPFQKLASIPRLKFRRHPRDVRHFTVAGLVPVSYAPRP